MWESSDKQLKSFQKKFAEYCDQLLQALHACDPLLKRDRSGTLSGRC